MPDRAGRLQGAVTVVADRGGLGKALMLAMSPRSLDG
jgi:hypothetical protein